MKKKIITTEWLVDVLRAVSANNRYTSLIKIPTSEEVQFVTDLLHSTLQFTFSSVENISDYDYEVLFSRYIDKRELFEAAANEFRFEIEVSKIPYYCETAQTTLFREVHDMPSLYDMTAVVFDNVYHDFVEHLQKTLGLDETSPYAKVKVLSVDEGKESYLLEIGGDIRMDVFKELFPHGSFVESDLQDVKEFLEAKRNGNDPEGDLQ